MTELFHDPKLAVAIALSIGLVVQIFARRVGLPGIVLLLTTGVALGPDGLGIVQPGALGDGLGMLVGFAVAVILFEGGLNLDIESLLKAQRPIRQLILVGAPVSAVLATGVARFILGWEWEVAVLFGLLAMVTGPTVINPLMKRLRVKPEVAHLLEAEGVLIDAIGAIAAAVAFEVAVSRSGGAEEVAGGVFQLFASLAFGVLLGLAIGAMLAWALRRRRLIPEGLENVFALTTVLVSFQLANALFHESGLAAVTIAGLVLGNVKNSVRRELREFKEQLTVMLLGMLFVLLAADVRLADVVALGWKAVFGVAAMLLIVRPFSVFAGTLGTDLGKRQRGFVAFIGPRGIVAAAVASYFASELGGEAGGELRAFMFVVIAVTVLVAGLLGGIVARVLDQRAEPSGWVLLGAHEVSQQLAMALKESGEPVLLLDSNLEAARHARDFGLEVIHGNALDEETLQEADLNMRRGIVAMTANEEVNLLFAREARSEAKGSFDVLTVVTEEELGITPAMVHQARAQLYGGQVLDIELWDVRLRRGTARLERWSLPEGTADPSEPLSFVPADSTLLMMLARQRGSEVVPFGEDVAVKREDVLWLLVNRERELEAHRWLEARGLRALRESTVDEPTDRGEPASHSA
ncbi:MAG: sodium:proton antiporter [Myxococcota bacterium]